MDKLEISLVIVSNYYKNIKKKIIVDESYMNGLDKIMDWRVKKKLWERNS